MKKVFITIFLILATLAKAQDKQIIIKNSDGSIQETGFITSDGKKDSIWVRYNEAGKIIGTAQFYKGTKNGIWETFNNEGVKLFEILYVNGSKKIGKRWDENGALIDSRIY